MEFEALKSILQKELTSRGVKEYEIYYSESESTSVETLNREQNNFSTSHTGGISLRVLDGGKMGYASTELMTEEEMLSLVERATKNAAATGKEDTVGIYGGGVYDNLAESDFTPLDTASLRALALETADKLYAASPLVADGTATSANTVSIKHCLYNSHGVTLTAKGGVNAFYMEAVARDGERSESAYAVLEYGSPETDSTVEKVVKEAETMLSAGLIPTGEYNLVINPKCMRSLLAAFSSSFSAKRAQMGMSRLKGKVGEKIASPLVTITDDPMRKGATLPTTFDAEGVPTHKRSVVEKGTLMTLLHNRETAAKDGVETTANASRASYSAPIGISPYSFAIEAGDKTLDELYALSENGILITELKGLHAGANPITGDFSIESAGIRIKDGKLTDAVRSFTVAGNFFELLSSISALSDKVEFGISTSVTSFGAPAVLVKGVKVSGT